MRVLRVPSRARRRSIPTGASINPTVSVHGSPAAGFCAWLAGGGVKAGYTHGETDDFGFRPVAGKVHLHDLHVTMLHLLGLDHERLNYRHSCGDYRLTNVEGRVVKEILA
jgi:hypothetical protein